MLWIWPWRRFVVLLLNISDSLKKMQELIDIINERKEDVDEIMGMLTERPMEEDNQDLLDELDAEIAKEDKNPSMSVPLPSVPTSIPTAAPVARMPQYDEEAELNAQLENLWFVCCIRLCSAVYPLCFLFKRKYDRKGTECVPQTAIQGKSNSRIHNERRKIAQSNLTVTPQ